MAVTILIVDTIIVPVLVIIQAHAVALSPLDLTSLLNLPETLILFLDQSIYRYSYTVFYSGKAITTQILSIERQKIA